MSSFIAESDVVVISATTTTSNTAVFTSGPSNFSITNAGTNPVLVSLGQGNTPNGNVCIPGGWPIQLQALNPERVPGTVYVYVTAVTGTSTVYVTPGFEA